MQAHDPDFVQSTGQELPAQGTLECPEAAHAFLLQGMRQDTSEARGVKSSREALDLLNADTDTSSLPIAGCSIPGW